MATTDLKLITVMLRTALERVSSDPGARPPELGVVADYLEENSDPRHAEIRALAGAVDRFAEGAGFELLRLRLAAVWLGLTVTAGGIAPASGQADTRRSTEVLNGILSSLGIWGEEAAQLFASVNGSVGGLNGQRKPADPAALLVLLHERFAGEKGPLAAVTSDPDFALYLVKRVTEIFAQRQGRPGARPRTRLEVTSS
jgi:hypothetical protein